MLALFGFFAAIGFHASIVWWLIGFLSLFLYPVALPVFGLAIAISFNAQWWVYVIGFLCLSIDFARD